MAKGFVLSLGGIGVLGVSLAMAGTRDASATNAAAKTDNVNVVNTPTVNVGTLPAVNVGSLPSVNVGSLPAVSVGSLPAVKLDPSSNHVVVDGTVNVAPSKPQRVQFDFVNPNVAGGAAQTYYVPSGKRLVIEQVFFTVAYGPDSIFDTYVAVYDGHTQHNFSLAGTVQQSTFQRLVVGSPQVTITADAGSMVFLSVGGGENSNYPLTTENAAMVGHLEDI